MIEIEEEVSVDVPIKEVSEAVHRHGDYLGLTCRKNPSYRFGVGQPRMLYSAAWALNLGGTEFYLEVASTSYGIRNPWLDQYELSGTGWSFGFMLFNTWKPGAYGKVLNRSHAKLMLDVLVGSHERFQHDLLMFKMFKESLE